MNKLLTRVVAPMVLVLFGVACAGVMVMLKPSAERSDPTQVAPLVEVIEARHSDHPTEVHARGTVSSSQRIVVVPQVPGALTVVSPRLIPGGRFREGEVMARIDPRDYQLTVRQEHSRVEQAELELKLEHGRQSVAKREWALLGDGRSEDQAPLALRKPQLANIELAVDAAKSGLARAELALERTRLRAPFNAMVITETVDVGQVVGSLSQLMTLVGTDQFWVRVSVSVDDLALIVLPTDGAPGSRVDVVQTLNNGGQIRREGRVIQLGGELDPQTRTASLLVAIDDPLDVPGLPMLPGAYVDVVLYGEQRTDCYGIPRRALLSGNQVLVVSGDNTLERRTVELVWGNADQVFIGGGVEAGERVIISTVTTAIEGMPVRVRSEETAEAVTGSNGRAL